MTNTLLNGIDNQREEGTPHGHEVYVCVCVHKTNWMSQACACRRGGEGGRDQWNQLHYKRLWLVMTPRDVSQGDTVLLRSASTVEFASAVGVSARCEWWPCDTLMTCPDCEPTFAQRRRESRIKDNKKWDQKKFQRHVVRLSLKGNYLMGGEYQSFRADLFCMKRRQERSVLRAAPSSSWIGATRFYDNRMEGKMKLLSSFCRFAMFSLLLSMW